MYNDLDIKIAVESSLSIAEVLRKLGLQPTGGNYVSIKHKFRRLNLDTTHFLGKSLVLGKKHKPSENFSLENILIKNSTYVSTNNLKKKLISSGVFEDKCYCCGLKDWNNKKLVFELEHINGIRTDNRLENLTLLCPNCHSQTHTFRGRNIKKVRTISNISTKGSCKYKREKRLYFCKFCYKEIGKRNKTGTCRKCSHIFLQKAIYPSIDVLIEEVKKSNYLAVGRKYGVSGNAIKKRILKSINNGSC